MTTRGPSQQPPRNPVTFPGGGVGPPRSSNRVPRSTGGALSALDVNRMENMRRELHRQAADAELGSAGLVDFSIFAPPSVGRARVLRARLAQPYWGIGSCESSRVGNR